MEVQGSIAGALIPIWIRGAGLVAGVLAWLKAPEATMRRDDAPRSTYSSPYAAASQPGVRYSLPRTSVSRSLL